MFNARARPVMVKGLTCLCVISPVSGSLICFMQDWKYFSISFSICFTEVYFLGRPPGSALSLCCQQYSCPSSASLLHCFPLFFTALHCIINLLYYYYSR